VSIPAYPSFAALSRAHKARIDELLRAHPPQTSELTFTNLYAWRDAYRFEVAEINGAVALRCGPHKFFPPLGDIQRVIAAAGVLLRDSGGQIVRADERLRDALAAGGSVASREDAANFDYVYRTQELVELSGRKYDGKRNLIKKFASAHAYEYVTLDDAHTQECLHFEEYWCSLRDCESVEGLANERRAFRIMLHELGAFGLRAGAIRVGGKILAVALAEPLNPTTLVMHILKADPNVPGLYQAMNREFLAREGGVFTWVNMEQDLGIPGLRKAKESYQPAHMVKKFTLSYAPVHTA
jgi:hypothetical protein